MNNQGIQQLGMFLMGWLSGTTLRQTISLQEVVVFMLTLFNVAGTETKINIPETPEDLYKEMEGFIKAAKQQKEQQEKEEMAKMATTPKVVTPELVMEEN